ncbi:peptide deformylase [Gracilibacillus caseinilyticus]|uniref:Peptide deformylase n=1 Tax=Gracilibacillus caseinilyticus TaxID=2932256 RepID=A0ABY4EY43_9BACI|nr:peptide deformylase [Gracilibacillus caseinilyticus]UOQ49327.1 peptide deformylase [Gracilibacillus caseinilyticus]
MSVKEVLLLGNPKLYKISSPVKKDEMDQLLPCIQDLHDTLMDFKRKYSAGRAIAAPQIGVFKRLIYMYIDQPTVFINPKLIFPNNVKIEVWDDCMSFPDLLVKVSRYKECEIHYHDIHWEQKVMHLENDLSELLQHEYDHLDGKLAISRAIDPYSFALRSQINSLKKGEK